jgi:hypothetical protein
VPATVALDLIPLRRVALRAQALNILDRGGATQVEREDMVVVDELRYHPTVLTALMVSSINSSLYMFWNTATGLFSLGLRHVRDW